MSRCLEGASSPAGEAWLGPTLAPSRWSALTLPRISRSVTSLPLVLLPAQIRPPKDPFLKLPPHTRLVDRTRDPHTYFAESYCWQVWGHNPLGNSLLQPEIPVVSLGLRSWKVPGPASPDISGAGLNSGGDTS